MPYKVVIEIMEFEDRKDARKFQDAVTDLLPHLKGFKKCVAAASTIKEIYEDGSRGG